MIVSISASDMGPSQIFLLCMLKFQLKSNLSRFLSETVPKSRPTTILSSGVLPPQFLSGRLILPPIASTELLNELNVYVPIGMLYILSLIAISELSTLKDAPEISLSTELISSLAFMK